MSRNEVNRTRKPTSKFDSRRELQESLPMHNPNEDYLKDFTPVRRKSSICFSVRD